MRAKERRLFALMLALFLGPLSRGSEARAHAGHPVLGAERTIKVIADGSSGLAVVVTLNFGPEAMLSRLRRADADSNGTITHQESSAFLRSWVEELRSELPIYVDGARARVRSSNPFFEPMGAIDRRPGTLEVRLHVSVGAGVHMVQIADHMSADEFERTDVLFESLEGARFVATGPTSRPTEVMPSFVYGPSADLRRVRSIGASIEMPDEAASELETKRKRRLAQIFFVVFGAPLLVVSIARMIRAMRSRKR